MRNQFVFTLTLLSLLTLTCHAQQWVLSPEAAKRASVRADAPTGFYAASSAIPDLYAEAHNDAKGNELYVLRRMFVSANGTSVAQDTAITFTYAVPKQEVQSGDFHANSVFRASKKIGTAANKGKEVPVNIILEGELAQNWYLERGTAKTYCLGQICVAAESESFPVAIYGKQVFDRVRAFVGSPPAAIEPAARLRAIDGRNLTITLANKEGSVAAFPMFAAKLEGWGTFRAIVASEATGKPAAPTASSQEPARFRDLHVQLKDVMAKLAKLQIEYRTANEDKRADIQQKWKELVAEGLKIEPKLIDAAMKAYQEAPNADKEIADFLVVVLREKTDGDEYEIAAKIGKLLMDNKCDVAGVANWAGIAAFATSDFAAAEKYLGQAKTQGYYDSPPKDDELAKRGDFYLQAIPAHHYKEAWAREKSFRLREANADLPRVLLKTTKGDIELELFEDQAPNTVANFISLVQSGFYKNVTFHRVLKGFMAQGGDPDGTGGGGPGYSIPDECHLPNHREHFRGTLSMAKTQLPDSGGSQFFLCFVPTPQLDGVHTVFGRVVSGMDVLAKIQRRDPQEQDPSRPDKILEAKVLRKRAHPYKPQKMPE